MAELKPCPWCKTTDKRKIIGKNFCDEFRVEHYCGFASILGRKFVRTEAEAIEAWNRRAGDI